MNAHDIYEKIEAIQSIIMDVADGLGTNVDAIGSLHQAIEELTELRAAVKQLVEGGSDGIRRGNG